MKPLVLLGALLLLSVGAWGQGCVGTCNVVGSVTFGGVAGTTLTSITVLPSSAAIPLHESVTYTALATFSDGTSADITAQAIWFLAPPGIASNSSNVVTCNAGGTVTVSAELAGLIGNTTLTCQSYQIVPQGDLTAFLNTPYAQQFTELGGTGPYSWSAIGVLPPGLSMSPAGILSGTPTLLGNYLFTVSDTDSSVPPVIDTAAVTVHVVAQQTEDSRYCNSNETITGLFADGPAQPLQNCNYTAIAGTPSPGSVLFVCPTAQTLANGSPDPNCNPVASPPFYNSVQAAVNAVTCGQTIKIYEIRGVATQNIYNENVMLPATTCFGGNWITVETRAIASLPAPGTRITPAWFGQAAIAGRPAYQQPAVPGIYGPMIRCVGGNSPGQPCQALATPASGSAASGWRFIGIEFTMPHGREPVGGTPAGFPSVAVCPNNFNGTPQCDPGFVSPIVSLGCSAPDVCGVTGASHIILDRVWIHGCDDKSSIGCKGQTREGLELQGGRHNSIVDSYINDIKTMSGVGPSVESHGIGGGNVKNTGDDISAKIVNNFLEASSVCFFYGGGASTTGVYTFDIEIRRNQCWKPLLWKLDDPSFPQMGGSITDAWVQAKGSGYANDPGTSCTIDAPTGPNPVQATCTAHVAGGQLLDVTITNPGSGYLLNAKFTFSGGNGKANAFPLVGIYNVKNQLELKNARRVLIEGNRFTNVWKGQSDQDANCILLTPKNAGNCLTCTVQDVTLRYNLCQGSNRAMNIGAEVDTRCGVNQTSNITSISESGTTVTVVVADVIVSKIEVGATADIAGVPITGYNGSFLITSINNATKTFTYTNATSGLGSSSGGTAAFTPPKCLSDGLARVSVHDVLFDGVNPIKWISKKSSFDGFGGSCWSFSNSNPQAISTLDMAINHNGCVTTSPTGAGPSALAGANSFNANCANTTALFSGFSFTNNYASGGVRATALNANGCFQCGGAGCGGSVTALKGTNVSDNLLPVSLGFYTTGQVQKGIVDQGGTYTDPGPTSCSFTGGGGSGAVCKLKVANGTVTAVWPDSVGSGYTSAPGVSFAGGTCPVTCASAHTALSGSGTKIASTKAWCWDHNALATAAFNGEVPMTPYPTAQGDATNNTCSSHGGGGNVSFNTWPDMHFINLPLDGSGSEIPTGDLHLLPGSPGKNAASDGLDIGPNIDLINQYTGCSIVSGLTVCP